MQCQPTQAALAAQKVVRPLVVSMAICIYLVDLVANHVYDAISDGYQVLPLSIELLVRGLLFLSVAIEGALLWLVSKGVNWARYALACLVLFLNIDNLATIDNPLDWGEHAISMCFIWLSIAAQFACVALLFSKQATLWFKNGQLAKNAA